MQNIRSSFPSSKPGFTLAELAIVMVIIGLLIGGVIKGIDIVRSAKVSRTVKEVQAVEAAIITFRNIYAMVPGDMAIASTRLANCDAAHNCVNGDGNGIVAGTRGSDDYDWNSKLSSAGIQMEAFQFWKHLALADLIRDVDVNADPASDARWGVTNPTSPFDGGFEFYYDDSIAGGLEFSRGHVMRMSVNGVNSSSPVGTPGIEALRPLEAAMIDRKADDGNPGMGAIRANYGVVTDECRDDSVYQERTLGETCVLFFRVFD